jgi:predicted aldo/keto reductase-like oxidoreductase
LPGECKKVFLITKSGHSNPDDLTQHLYDSLQRMQTGYIDLFLIQAVSDVKKEITRDIRSWAERTKSTGKIRFFGFSTHKNMESCLVDGAQLGGIDGIMTTYNYRLMHTDPTKKAVAKMEGASKLKCDQNVIADIQSSAASCKS